MVEITPDTDKHIYIGGIRYLELTAEEVKNLPEQTLVSIAELIDGKISGKVEQYVTGLRYRRPVLYKLPLMDTYKNIGTFADRMYLFRGQKE